MFANGGRRSAATIGSSIRIGVLDNDLGKQLRVIWFDEPTDGSVSLKGNELVYTPDRGTERDSLRYIVMDANGTTDDALVLIGVIATRSSPVANPDTAITDVDTPVTIDVSSNDVDSDPGDTISIVSVTDPMHGTSTLGPGNTVIYTPDPGYTGADSFGYTARSGGSEKTGPDTATVFVNGPPDAVDDAATTNQEVAVVIPVLGNDSDPEGDEIEVVAVAVRRRRANGTPINNGDGTVTYTPDTGFCGSDSFTYTIADPRGLTDVATVRVDVNCPPDAAADAASVNEGATVTIDVLVNDSDPDAAGSPPLTTGDVSYSDNGDLTEGTLVDNTDGTFDYTAAASASASATFTYTITDPGGLSDTATVTIAIGGCIILPLLAPRLTSHHHQPLA